MKILCSLFLFFMALQARAWIIDLNAEFGSDTFSTTAEQKNIRGFYFLGMLGDIKQGERLNTYVGWGAISASAKDSNDSPSIDQTFSTLDTGPLFRFGFGSRGVYSLSLLYALVAKGKLDIGGASSDISGSSYLIKFAIEPEVAEKVCIGFTMNYYAASYAKAVTNSTETDVSYKFQRMFPSISLSYRF